MWRRKKLQWPQLRKPENNWRAMLNPNLNSLCCIYRFRCIFCSQRGNEFNYVGQLRNFGSRYRQHSIQMMTDWMNHEKRMAAMESGQPIPRGTLSLSSSVLYEHAIHWHADTPNFSDIFEADIVHRLPEHRGNNASDSRNRRRWGKILSPWAKKVADRAVNISFSCSSLPLYALSMSFPSRNSIAILSDFRIFHAAFSGGVSASTEFQNSPTSKNAYTGQSSLFKNSFNNINWLEFGSYIRSDRRDRM